MSAEQMDQDSRDSRTFVEAVRYKYLDAMSEAHDVHIYVPRRSPADLTESGDLILPTILPLTDSAISDAGDTCEILRMSARVAELHLTQNRISRWEEVFRIVENIPNLIFLNLTSNPVTSCPETPKVNFTKVEQLVLNDTHIDWNSLLHVLAAFPTLSQLHLSLNSYSSVEFPDTFTYPSLRHLQFNRNRVDDWHHVISLGHAFPSLENLVMTECRLTSLGAADDIRSAFPKLTTLNLSQTCLESWEEVDKLRHFPKLRNVRLVGIPFLEAIQEKSRRMQLVARTPHITQLNGSPVHETERADAERAFLRRCEELNVQPISEELNVQPIRYQELVAKYGKLQPLAKVNLKPRSTVKVKVVFDQKKEDLDVCVNQTVTEFKKMLVNIVGHPPSKWRLYYHDLQISQGPDIMKYPNLKLHTYNIEDGDEFIIEMKK